MSTFVEMLKNNPDTLFGKGSTSEEITNAENALQLSFAPEYKDYLSTLTLVAFEGRELTGLCKSKRLNVVDVTLAQRKLIPDMPSDLYVVEETNIDGIVIWQNQAGKVFQTAPNACTMNVADSLAEYYSPLEKEE